MTTASQGHAASPGRQDVPLWSTLTQKDAPRIEVYRPAAGENRGAAVVICPGGGYAVLAPHEAEPVASWLTGLGITAAILRYRLGPQHHHPDMLNDAARAMRIVRQRSGEWGVDSHRIGVLGFSAGGHLASTISTHFDRGKSEAADPVERVSSRPDFTILIYPVITLSGPYAHLGSRDNLLGAGAPPDLIEFLSSEKQVTADTPPAFLVCTNDDTGVPCENSILYALALRAEHVPVELHLYEHGQHGFGMGGADPVLSQWPLQCATWLRARAILRAPAAPAADAQKSVLPG